MSRRGGRAPEFLDGQACRDRPANSHELPVVTMRIYGASAGCAFCACLLASSCGSAPPGPLSPRDALQSFRIADGFRIELFASEPHVVDPVEMAFDESGGVFVAELLDNPHDPPTGQQPLSRIKYLEDTDSDGMVDRHTVFAEGLLAVEGIAPWKGGLIVTAAPDILFLKDTDGDHQADVRETLYTGFAVPNVETRISNPRLGLDNWFYVVNFGNPGEVRSLRRPDAPTATVRNREFRFHPLRGLGEPAPGNAQFGHDYNERGHWFVAHNTVHLRHTVFPPGYLPRNPHLVLERPEQDISDHGQPAAAVFPLSQPQQWRIDRTVARQKRYAETRPGRAERLEGYFTAASGTTVYLGDAFPSELRGSVFVGEGNGNLVHCDILTPSGPTYSARRWPEGADFLASTDNWFRPVNFSNAPDGNLYVVDYYRQYLEHPDFIPDAIKKRLKMNFRAGDTLGRIYRIVPDKPKSEPRNVHLGMATSHELVGLLGHSSGWHRRTAHRLLLERQDESVVEALGAMARSGPTTEARLHALWVLEGLNVLAAGLVGESLGDSDEAVRENALRLTERFPGNFAEQVLEAIGDESPRVAFQAALTAGDFPASPALFQAYATGLARFPESPWFHFAVLSAPPVMAAPVLERLVRNQSEFFVDPSKARKDYLRRVARVIGAGRSPSEIEGVLQGLVTVKHLAAEPWKVMALEGLADGLALREGRRLPTGVASAPMDALLGDGSEAVRAAAAKAARFFDLSAHVKRASDQALDPSVPLSRRVIAARTLQGGNFEEVSGALAMLLRTASDSALQTAAAESLAAFNRPEVSDILIAAWPAYKAGTRSSVAEILIRRDSLATAFLGAIADGRIAANEVAPITRIRLSQHPNEHVRRSAAVQLPSELGDRGQIVARYMGALDIRGDVSQGKKVFESECANCHLSNGSRGRIGPDLSGVTNRSNEDLLTSILDPSYAIENRFRNYLLETTDARFYDGILVAETTASVTLRGENRDISVLKEDIAELRESAVSLMPEGLEEALTDQDLADLLAYLRSGL